MVMENKAIFYLFLVHPAVYLGNGKKKKKDSAETILCTVHLGIETNGSPFSTAHVVQTGISLIQEMCS